MMMIQHKNTGTIYRQNIPFQWVTHDWNNDGDIYPMYVSYFDAIDKNPKSLSRVEILKEDLDPDGAFKIISK